MARNKDKEFSGIPLIYFLEGKPKPEPKTESKPGPTKQVIQEVTSHIPDVPDLLDHWYDMKGNQCPRCKATETIDIPEYPTTVCKQCWENKCRSCTSVTAIKSDGSCPICLIQN